jgi:hypothetical protein
MTTRTNSRAEAEVDFNDREPDGTLPALDSDLTLPPFVGLGVRLFDDGGNEVEGVVRRIDGRIAFIEPDWTSWASAYRPAEVFWTDHVRIVEGMGSTTMSVRVLPRAS